MLDEMNMIAQFESMTRDAGQLQASVLRDILRRNAHTHYLRACCPLPHAHTFKQCVPLITHADVLPFFTQIADGHGDPPLLTADPVTTLSLSSGTTSGGQQKYLILYKEILEASDLLFKIGSAYRARDFPIRPGGRVLELVFCGRLSKTKGGLITGTATTHLFRSEEFKLKQTSSRVRPCAPEEVVNGEDTFQAMYCHLLCGLLLCDQVEYVNSTFAYTLVEAMRTLELQWRCLCEDIENGKLNPLVKDPIIRMAMRKTLVNQPNPELARALTEKFMAVADDNWQGVIPLVWPNCKYVLAIMTGSMEHYAKKLRHYAGALPLVSGDYGATESWIAVNANPAKTDPTIFSDIPYTVVPSFAYFEFIPLQYVESEHANAFTLGLTEVQIGQNYELVVTTYGGLYRYRLGDIVRVTGFMNASPQIAYVCRRNVSLCINVDKNTERDLQMVVDKAAKLLGSSDLELVEYTSRADLCSTPGHYVIFWELKFNGTNVPGKGSFYLKDIDNLLDKCATTMDLAFVDPGYVGSRKGHTIGPLKLSVVRPGTFRSLLERHLNKGSAITQYKTSRCMSSQELIQILERSVLSSRYSSAYKV